MVGLQCPQEATQKADKKLGVIPRPREEMAIRPAEALLGLLGEQDREAGLRPRCRAEALELRNPGRPEAAR